MQTIPRSNVRDGRHCLPLRLPSLDSFVQDVRYAARTLRGSPGFTAIAVLILALGIGANTAIFSLVSAVLLKPLPFERPDRLVLLWEDLSAAGGPARINPTPATYVQWKTRSRAYEDMTMFIPRTYNLIGGGEPERLAGVRTDTNLFSILGLQPLLGRTFSPDDEGPGASPVVVISEELWRRRFGANPSLIGRTIDLDGLQRTVIGVIPPHFRYPDDETAVWLPAQFSPAELAETGAFNYYVLARLAPGVERAAAQAEISSIALAMQRDARSVDTAEARAVVAGLQEDMSRETRPTLYVLLAAVGTILLITCANVANLLLARSAHRQKELAVRKAIGAANGRVLRQLLTESAVLAAGGVVLGVALSTLSFAYLARLVPATFPGGSSPGLDWRVLSFTVGLTVLTVLLFGAGPALAAARRGFNETLKKGVGANAAPRSGRLRNTLVVAEITFTVVLLAAAGLLLRSYAAVLAVDPGFRADNLLVAETPLALSKYRDALADRTEFYRRVLERVSALPGVRSAGYVNAAPLVFQYGRAYVSIEGQAPPPPAESARNVISDRVASAGYFETLGVPLLQGRLFDSRDTADSEPTAIINQAMARRFWGNRDPIGARIKIGNPDNANPWFTVIGIVGDVRQFGLDAAPEPEFTFAATQSAVNFEFFWPRHLLVRTDGDPLALAAAVRGAVWDVDANQPVASVRSMREVLDAELTSRNMQMTLVGSFAVLALLLASVGLYGVLSYTVAQRTAEIGLRMALGAQTRTVVRGVIRSALGLAGIGIALGLAGAFGVTRFLSSFLFGVSPMDPATLAAVAVLLVVVTMVASWVPARRAAGVDPVTALRSD
jgi:putative ABC transport system permease protein